MHTPSNDAHAGADGGLGQGGGLEGGGEGGGAGGEGAGGGEVGDDATASTARSKTPKSKRTTTPKKARDPKPARKGRTSTECGEGAGLAADGVASRAEAADGMSPPVTESTRPSRRRRRKAEVGAAPVGEVQGLAEATAEALDGHEQILYGDWQLGLSVHCFPVCVCVCARACVRACVRVVPRPSSLSAIMAGSMVPLVVADGAMGDSTPNKVRLQDFDPGVWDGGREVGGAVGSGGGGGGARARRGGKKGSKSARWARPSLPCV
jgi:hypothetical protein